MVSEIACLVLLFAHSNQWAELAVKSMKRLLRENFGSDGKLNSDKVQRAVMQYRNTPDRDTGRSPAQVIFGRQLRDFLPAPLSRYKPHPRWLMLQEDREMALRQRALRNTESLKTGTRQLAQLQVHDTVKIQNQIGHKASRWDITGTIVEVKPYDQYLVRVHGSGRLTLGNRKFLKKISPYGAVDKIPSISWKSNQSTDMIYRDITRNEENDNSPSIANLTESKDLSQDQSSPQIETLPDMVVPNSMEDQTEVSEIPNPVDEPILRRSTRNRVEPKRLNVETWKGKSYENDEACSAECGEKMISNSSDGPLFRRPLIWPPS